jgi:hypothetical protein
MPSAAYSWLTQQALGTPLCISLPEGMTAGAKVGAETLTSIAAHHVASTTTLLTPAIPQACLAPVLLYGCEISPEQFT